MNYAAATLGLRGEEGDAVSTRIWNAVDSRLKVEAGPGTDCLLTRVKSRYNSKIQLPVCGFPLQYLVICRDIIFLSWDLGIINKSVIDTVCCSAVNRRSNHILELAI